MDNRRLVEDSCIVKVTADQLVMVFMLFSAQTGKWHSLGNSLLLFLSDLCQHCPVYLRARRYQEGFGFSSVWWRAQKPR